MDEDCAIALVRSDLYAVMEIERHEFTRVTGGRLSTDDLRCWFQ